MSYLITIDPTKNTKTTPGLEADCPICGAALELHQPDPEKPAGMLAVCSGCAVWFIDLSAVEIRDFSRPRARQGD